MVIKVDIDENSPELHLDTEIKNKNISLTSNSTLHNYNRFTTRIIFYLLMFWILTLMFREITFLSKI